MLKVKTNKGLILIILSLILIGFLACSPIDDDTDDTTTNETDTTNVEDSVQVTEVYLSASPDSLNYGETSTITVAVYNSSGSGAAELPVVFSLDRPSVASVSPAIVSTNSAGIATTTLTARNLQGEVNITATVSGVSSDPLQVSVLSGVTAATINMVANPTTILTNGTATITAEVLDNGGFAVTDGTTVLFSLDNPVFGDVSTSSATTVNGFATTTFESSTTPGTAQINASSGGATGSVDVLINQTQPASLEFIEASPQLVAIAGSGGVETSYIRFQVNDENGYALSGISVNMTMEGPGGGEYIDNDATPLEIDVSSDADGIAEVLLRSGTTPGPVTILAEISVDGVPFRARSSVVSIGGGVPSAGRFSVAASILNIPGLNKNGLETDITAYLSDRFGNYNILAGTTVTFLTEPALAIDTQQATVTEDGLATVTARTQHPVLNPVPGGYLVNPFTWEENLLSYVQTNFGWPETGYPRWGLVSVLVITDGEEQFDDLNANGIYDIGTDPFLEYDTYDDPFIDYNDDNTYTVGDAIDPDEIFIDPVDTPTEGVWDGKNGVWDSDKKIFFNFPILITGGPIMVTDLSTFVLPNDTSLNFNILIADPNLNVPSGGTTIKISVSGCAGTSYDEKLEDSSYLPGSIANMSEQLGRILYPMTIRDSDPDTIEAKEAKITISINWEGVTSKTEIIGTSY